MKVLLPTIIALLAALVPPLHARPNRSGNQSSSTQTTTITGSTLQLNSNSSGNQNNGRGGPGRRNRGGNSNNSTSAGATLYTGSSWSVGAGTLSLGNSSHYLTSNSVAITAGVVTGIMETQSASGFQVTRVSTDNASVNASTGTFNPGTSTTLTNNALGGTGSIVATGVGTMILDVNASVYSGGTVLSGSTLTLGSTNTSNISHAVSLSGAAVTGVTESFSFPSGGTLTLDSNTLGLVSDGTYYIHRTSTGAPITDIFSLPEPGSTLLLASGIGALLLRRRRTPRS